MAIGNPHGKDEALLTTAKSARLPAEREAWLNTAFYLGHQYVEWHQPRGEDGFIREIRREPGTENYPRVVINKIMHYVRTAQADVLQERPTGDVLPPSASFTDRSDARVARAWIEDQADAAKLDYDTRLQEAAHEAMLCGNGYLKWTWDAQNDRPRITVPSFFEVVLDPYAKSFKHCRYLFQQQFMDPEQVFDTYGVEVKPGSGSEADEVKTALLRGMGASPVINGVVVNELWMKPSRRNPRGRYVVWTGTTTLVQEQPLPYPHLIANQMLPFTIVGAIARPGSPYHLSPVQYLRPPQMELNAYHNQLLLNRKTFANGKWWIDEALDLDEDPDDSYNQILRGRASVPGTKPELIQGAVFPNNGDGEWLEQQMMHIVGQHEVSQAQVPGRVEAAKAIELLKESDADAMSVMRKSIEVGNTEGWFHLIEEARHFQKTPAVVASYSKEGIPEVKHFMAGKMAPGYRIRTSQTTSLARSRANRQDLIMRLWDSKVIQDPEVMAELLDMPLPNTVSARADDLALARGENYVLADSTPIEPQSWHDHATHLQEHNSYRKTAEFDALPPKAKQAFEHHCQRHQDLQKSELQKQVELQMIMNGGQPPQPGQAATAPAAPITPPDQTQEAQ